uniref:Aquaporin 8a, tandem duplicate 1 n=1 Tax=Gasterosteus aculeatus aculeatus TaxID=481459 RepID=G3P368_GASAC
PLWLIQSLDTDIESDACGVLFHVGGDNVISKESKVHHVYCSGGHFNPAVSLSVYLCGGMELTLLLPYVLTQLGGGLVGAGLTRVRTYKLYNASHGGAFNVVSKDLGRTTLAEAVMTLFLTVVVVMGAVNSRTRSPWVPFCVGLTVTANIFAGGSLSGACMNPARAFGPAAVANHWSHHWIYWVGPTSGALLTVVFIRYSKGSQIKIILKADRVIDKRVLGLSHNECVVDRRVWVTCSIFSSCISCVS